MMTKALLILAVVLFFICAGFEAAAQSDVALATRQVDLQQLSDSLKIRDDNYRRQAREVADRLGIPVRRELPGGRVLELQRIAPGIGPVFYITNNVDAADTVSTDEVWPGGSAGLDLDGNGMTVAEWDGGAVYAHPDFSGRLSQVDGATVVSNHSTHVAGTLIGAGDWLVPDARGMAYAAHLDAYDWNSDTAEMAAAAAGGLLLSNHSYGIAAGWLFIGDFPPDRWWWIGGENPSDVEDPNFGYYDTQAQLWDQIAYDAPYYLIVKASGNDRSDIGPTVGEEYTVIDQDGNFLFTSMLTRQPDCWPDGYDCLPTASVAKNILTVGAVDDLIGGYSQMAGPSSVQMADFSSWGPTDDGRLKPDLVANGMFLMSTYGESPYYAAAAGTSMSAPNVTGSLVLLQEHYQDLHGANNFMRAATLKALVIHTADEAGNTDGPDYAFGWGLLNTKTAAEVISEDGGAHRIIEDSLVNGALESHVISVTDPDSVITATLVWADPPATPVAPSLDPPDLMLVNDLDLRIRRGPATYLPWVLDSANPANPASRSDNFRDNVEQVKVTGASPGSYTIEVSHKGTLLNGVAQDHALIISVETAPPVTSSLYIDESFSGGLPAGWSIETLRGASWTIKSPDGNGGRLDNQTGGTGNFAMVDNDYIHNTVTSLRTSTFDLSTAEAVVLRFKSYLVFDTIESLNVDASTDGGTNWNNVWTHQGFNPFPTNYVVDLTGSAAGHSSYTLRFRYDSENWISGDLWQIDEVELEVFESGPTPGDPPGPASNPSPGNSDTGVSIEADLSWTAGSDTTSHDVYFNGVLQGNQAASTFSLPTLAHSTTYNWRIDEVNANGTTTGTTWSFTTEAAAGPPEFRITDIDVVTVNVKGPRNRGVATVLVLDETSSPVSGVAISGTFSGDWSGTRSGTTNSLGQVSVETPQVKNGSSWQFCVDTASKSGWTFDAAGSSDWICSAPPPPPPPDSTGTVSGQVSDAGNGNPVQGASVSADTGQNGNTDSAGNYTLSDVPVGTRQVSVSVAGYEPASQQLTVTDGGTSTLDFSLTAVTGGGTGTLKGTVRNSSGTGLSGVSVQVLGGPSASTNKRGKYTIRDVGEGLRTITASVSGYSDSTSQVTISAGTTATLDFSLSPQP
jgi:hypothetical protein